MQDQSSTSSVVQHAAGRSAEFIRLGIEIQAATTKAREDEQRKETERVKKQHLKAIERAAPEMIRWIKYIANNPELQHPQILGIKRIYFDYSPRTSFTSAELEQVVRGGANSDNMKEKALETKPHQPKKGTYISEIEDLGLDFDAAISYFKHHTDRIPNGVCDGERLLSIVTDLIKKRMLERQIAYHGACLLVKMLKELRCYETLSCLGIQVSKEDILLRPPPKQDRQIHETHLAINDVLHQMSQSDKGAKRQRRKVTR